MMQTFTPVRGMINNLNDTGEYVKKSDYDLVIAALLMAEAKRDQFDALLNTPELHDFSKAVVLEAAHQRERWPAAQDAGKTPADWFWLVGYLAGKALHSQAGGNTEKALHHTISTAAALANWHAAITGQHTAMRPDIAEPNP